MYICCMLVVTGGVLMLRKERKSKKERFYYICRFKPCMNIEIIHIISSLLQFNLY